MEVLKSTAQNKELRHEQQDFLSFEVHREETEKEANSVESPSIFLVK